MKGTISKIKLFKACQRAYFFKYIENLIPVNKSEALETGTSYHEKLEELYDSGSIDISDYSKESAMAIAYQKYIYPKFNVTAVEKWEERPCGKHVLFGRVDGIADDGSLVEHKTTSISIEEFEYNLQWDEQILVYMWLTGARKVYYTICKKPTIRQRQNESAEEFFNRMIAWYDEDTDSKIRLITLERTDEEIEDCIEELGLAMDNISDLENQGIKKYQKNTCYCNHWGRRCEYSNICLNYDPNIEYVEFVRGE